MKILFMGTPDFAKTSLEKLYLAGFNIIGVYTNPDKPAGRGMKIKPSPVKEYAISKKINVYQPEKLKNNKDVINNILNLKPDLIVVVAYGKILPKEILDIPKYGCINVHASLLPKYRGAAPMQWALINGEKKTGVTTMLMDEGMDTGDMLLKEETNISEEDNFETIHDKLMVIGSELLIKTIKKLENGDIIPEKQGKDFTYAPMITKDTTKIDFNKTSKEIYNFVRGLSPFPGMYIENKDSKYKVYKVMYYNDEKYNNFKNGEVCFASKDTLSIKCGKGYINILTIQPQNSRKMDISSFLAGNKVDIGTLFNN